MITALRSSRPCCDTRWLPDSRSTAPSWRALIVGVDPLPEPLDLLAIIVDQDLRILVSHLEFLLLRLVVSQLRRQALRFPYVFENDGLSGKNPGCARGRLSPRPLSTSSGFLSCAWADVPAKARNKVKVKVTAAKPDGQD